MPIHVALDETGKVPTAQLPKSQGGVTLEQVKADTDIADAISKKHAYGSDNQDLSGYVLTNDSRLSDARTPTTHGHAISDVTDLTTTLAGKETFGAVSSHEGTYNHTNYNTAYSHSQAAHAPSGAQANADITKAEIEAKLTGEISSHSHSGGADPFTNKLVLGSDKPTGANTTPVTLGLSFDYAAGSKYVIDIYAIVAPAVAGTGCGFLIDVSSTVTYVGTFTAHQLAATGTVSGGSSIGDLGATSQGVSSGMVGTGSNFVYGGGMVITGANTGTATFFFRSETTAVTTCKAATMIRVMKMA